VSHVSHILIIILVRYVQDLFINLFWQDLFILWDLILLTY